MLLLFGGALGAPSIQISFSLRIDQNKELKPDGQNQQVPLADSCVSFCVSFSCRAATDAKSGEGRKLKLREAPGSIFGYVL